MTHIDLYLSTTGGWLALDTAEGDVGFSRKNFLFSFGKYEMMRSVTMTLPATAANDRAFEVGRSTYHYSTALSQTFPAKMVVGSVAMAGELYVNQATPDGYECVFVNYEYEKLVALQNAGNIADIIAANHNIEDFTIEWGEQSLEVVTPDDWGLVRHIKHDVNSDHYDADPVFFPFIPFRMLLDLLGLGATALPTFGIFQNYTRLGFLVTQPQRNQFYHTHMYNDGSAVYVQDIGVQLFDNTALTTGVYPAACFGVGLIDAINPSTNTGVGRCSFYGFSPLEDLELKFPNTFDPDLFLVRYKQHHYDLGRAVEFVGDYKFVPIFGATTTYRVLGAPLAGRTVSLRTGEFYFFMKKENYVNTPTRRGGYGTQPTWADTFEIRRENSEAKRGDLLYLTDNLPDISVFELLQSIAMATHTFLIIDDNGDPQFVKWTDVKANRNDVEAQALELVTIKNGFGDWAAENVMVDARERALVNYTLPIRGGSSNDIFKSPFSNADKYLRCSLGGVLSRDVALYVDVEYRNSVNGQYPYGVNEGDRFAIGYGYFCAPVASWDNITGKVLMYCGMFADADFQNDLQTTRTIELHVLLSPFVYYRMTPYTMFVYHDMLWTWISADIQGEEATLTLANLQPT